MILKGYVDKDNKIRRFKVILTNDGLEIATAFYLQYQKHVNDIVKEFTLIKKTNGFIFEMDN